MPSKITNLAIGEYYHVYNRGVDKRIIFETQADYVRFYNSLKFFNVCEPVQNLRLGQSKSLNKSKPLVEVHAYNLLPNHFHLLLKQVATNGISEFMKRVTGGYTGYFNEKYQRSGSLFQGTFKRKHIGNDESYRYLLCYVNENALVHKIIRKDETFFSSRQHYKSDTQSPIVTQLIDDYDSKSAEILAIQIYKKRNADKDKLIIET